MTPIATTGTGSTRDRWRWVRWLGVPFLALALLTAGMAVAWHRRHDPGPLASTVSTLPVGSSTQHLEVDGETRVFHLYRPSGLEGPVPLVVMLHGGFGSGRQAEDAYGWDAQADIGRFVVAYPDGLNRAWNAGGGCCGKPGANGTDDIAFISRMVTAVGAEISLDPDRIYATGISNGGILSYRLACETTIFAAIGPDSATLLGDCVDPAPISVLHLHGSADTRIRYEGGEGDGTAKITGPPVPTVVATWRTTDACDPPTTTTTGPVTTSIATCEGNRTVELITIDGAGHQWPGAKGKSAIQKLLGADPPSTALDATQTLWEFFAAHPK